MKRLLPLLLALLTAGCEVLEEDISGREVRIAAPADNVTVTPGVVAFRWQAVDHAAGYEFTVVAPSFAAAERIVADTVLRADSLARSYGCRVDLAEGEYQWSVRAFNGGYTTRTEVRSLTVVASEKPADPATAENSSECGIPDPSGAGRTPIRVVASENPANPATPESPES